MTTQPQGWLCDLWKFFSPCFVLADPTAAGGVQCSWGEPMPHPIRAVLSVGLIPVEYKLQVIGIWKGCASMLLIIYSVHTGKTGSGPGCYEPPREGHCRRPKPRSIFQSRIINFYSNILCCPIITHKPPVQCLSVTNNKQLKMLWFPRPLGTHCPLALMNTSMYGLNFVLS